MTTQGASTGQTSAAPATAAHSHGTLAEQLLGARTGEHVVRQLDLVYSHDATTLLSTHAFEALGGTMANPTRVAVVFDHAYPAPDIKFATFHQRIRDFVARHEIPNFFPGHGICHLVLPDAGLVGTGSLVLGADSHSVTLGALGAYALGAGSTDVGVAWATGATWFRVPHTIRVELSGAPPDGVGAKDIMLELVRRLGPDGGVGGVLEFGGPALATLSMDARFTLTNMASELGADTGLMETDETTRAFLETRGATWRRLVPSANARYHQTVSIDLTALVPMAALPPDLQQVARVADIDDRVDRVLVGSCTNGRVEDLHAFATALSGRAVNVETIVTPASRSIMRTISADGTLERLHAAGCVVLAPGCGACLGRHQGVLAPGETVLTTFNRNYPGRMGAPDARIYLASPQTAAETAVTGRISSAQRPSRVGPRPAAAPAEVRP